MLRRLQAPVDDNEIKSTILGMNLKAPGLDGLHTVFYQSQWPVVGPSVCCFIKNIFASKHVLEGVNKTLVILIPKTDNPLNLKMYRPISLCNVVNKTMTKLAGNRLQNVLSLIIGPPQTSFVPGRHIIENVIIAQEVIHSMTIKVDLQKLMTG